MRIAIIGCGEVGATYARALAEHDDHDIVLCDPEPRPDRSDWARRQGVDLHEGPGAWLGSVDRAWVCVAGDLAHEVVLAVLEHLPPAGVVVDLTTAAPEDKRRSAAAAAGRAHYVDAVIMGALGLTGAKTPLLATGPLAVTAAVELADLGAPVRALPDAGPGDAAALKLLRSVLTKGLEALGVECLLAAEELGVRDELPAVLADIDDEGLTSFLDAVVRTHPVHAGRRRHEVGRAAHQLAAQGRPSTLLRAVEERFALTAEAVATHPPAPGTTDDLDGALAWLAATSPRTTTHRS